MDGRFSDPALLSVMRYPYFGFTEPELAQIRIRQKETQTDDKSFYNAVRAFEEESELGQKVQSFLEKIAYYRQLSQCLKLPDFLMQIRQEAEFQIYARTSPDAKSSDSAISVLIGGASLMQDAPLRDFLSAADRMMPGNEAQKPGETNAVYMTTIHKSKGLEFPVVILSGMHKAINQSDASGPVLVGRELGLALDIVDQKARTRRPTFHKKAVARIMKKETVSETIRLLYVGMTRAVDRLVIIGAGKAVKEKWMEDQTPGWQHEGDHVF